MVLYKDSTTDDLFNECWYMKRYRIRTITWDDLQDEPETVYVLSREIPFGGNRRWIPVFDEGYIRYKVPEDGETGDKEKKLYLYKGVRVKKGEQNEEWP